MSIKEIIISPKTIESLYSKGGTHELCKLPAGSTITYNGLRGGNNKNKDDWIIRYVTNEQTKAILSMKIGITDLTEAFDSEAFHAQEPLKM